MKSLTKTELSSLLTVAKKHSDFDHLLLTVTFNHGLRISETLALTRDNIVGGFLVVQRKKGSRKTTQPILASEKAGLERLAQSEGRFFPVDRKTVWRHLQKYGEEAGVPQFKRHAHCLKHTTGRLAYEGGMGIPELQTYLGHVNGKNTMVYLESTEEQAASAFSAAVGQ
jgi:integrase